MTNEDMSYQQSYQLADDDVFHWNENVGFSGVSRTIVVVVSILLFP
jgi:hypothetical protein